MAEIKAGSHDPQKMEAMLGKFKAATAASAERPSYRTGENPMGEAQFVSVKLVRFIEACAFDHGLSPEEIFYAVNLAAINVMNDPLCPLSAVERADIESRVSAFYLENKP